MAASLGPSVETVLERKGAEFLESLLYFCRAVCWGSRRSAGCGGGGLQVWEGGPEGEGELCQGLHSHEALSSMGDSLGKLLEGEEGVLDITGVDEVTGVTKVLIRGRGVHNGPLRIQ